MPKTAEILLIIFGCAAAFCLLNILLYLFVLLRPHGKKPPDEALLCDYAHRGLHGDGVPENSLRAFELAALAGFGIELDVQLSADGVVMVFHDATLLRMTGDERRLCDVSADALGRLHLDGSEEYIPTLAEVLRLVDGRVPLLVELKGETTDTSLCRRVAEQLKTYRGAFCVESFNPLLLRTIKRYMPSAYCGLLYTNVVRDKSNHSPIHALLTAMALNILCRPHFIAYNERDRRALPVRLCTELFHAPRFVWTVRSREALNTAHERGECAIFEKIADKMPDPRGDVLE